METSSSTTFRFTAPKVESASCPIGKQQVFYRDATTEGLGLRVMASGAKAYIYESRVRGMAQVIRITIGNPKSWMLDDAKTEARRLKVLCDQGIDPRGEKVAKAASANEARQEVVRASATLGNVWTEYMQDRASVWKDRHLADHQSMVITGGEAYKRGNGTYKAGPLACLLGYKLAELTLPRILEWQQEENKTRATRCALAVRLLKAFANWCEEHDAYAGLLPDGVFSKKKVQEKIHKAAKGDVDCLQQEQLAAWFAAVRGRSLIMSAYLQSLLITGARREEMADLQWGDVDFNWKTMIIRDKVEGVRTIPLTNHLAELLNGLPRFNQWVFSSPRAETGRIQSPNKAHTEAVAGAGLPHLTLHGLRRSFSTLAEWVEAPAGVIAQIQGHKPSAIAEKHYKRRSIGVLRAWHQKIEDWMLEQAPPRECPLTFDAATQEAPCAGPAVSQG